MNRPVDDGQAAGKIFPPVVFIVAVLMIVFGLAEVVTGFTHRFFGLATAQVSLATVLGVALGFFYLAGGVLLLTQKRRAAILAVILLCGDILGRIALVIFGLYPLDSFRQTFGIAAGTAIAAGFAIYIGSKLKSFR